MLRRNWKPIAATALGVGTSVYMYRKYRRPTTQTFDIAVKEMGADGKPTTVNRTFPLQSMDDVNRRIREHAVLKTKSTPEGLVWKYATGYLASNDPIEDANAQAIIDKDPTTSSSSGQLLFFTVMDGHAGRHTSRLLSSVLIPAVALELSTLVNDTDTPLSKTSILDSVKSLLFSKSDPHMALDSDPKLVSQAIQRAFLNLDIEIVNAPLHILASEVDQGAIDKRLIPDLSKHPMGEATMLPAMSGSCALMALLDTSHRDLYVACTGDSRAVAGIWEETEDGQGKWRVEVLSEDQTGRNPNEVKRMQSEHPASEAADVIKRGRVLGGLEPTRAFGDARYKWSREAQEILSQAFLAGNGKAMRPTSPAFKTPPYVTANPVVTHRKLTIPDKTSTDASTKSKPTFRFLVLATDGLWDQLSSEEVVALVGGYLAGLKGTVPKSSLPSMVPTTAGSPTVEGKDKNRKAGEGSWSFVDDNVSAHLIRNAFGGGDEGRLRRLLSIPAPFSRRWRDDVTVTVVWWDEEQEEATTVKAKL
ncbi:hypothetical protein EW146_g6608 [Bondarzewia mesenterica]|uniref:PPM-type phosphatase domain-containing protein n=1 Tax=Bondarzewia mesenterica TaxID=1095465 RepID=A0A4S4LQ29_9AGAM|nr:hypothetical protein EW146_g6608 [Bondarzewia mesenterica]